MSDINLPDLNYSGSSSFPLLEKAPSKAPVALSRVSPGQAGQATQRLTWSFSLSVSSTNKTYI